MSRFSFKRKVPQDQISQFIALTCSEIKSMKDDDSVHIENEISKERRDMLFCAEMDAETAGWDKAAKMWAIVPDEDTKEEYLHLLDEGIAGDPIDFLEAAALHGTLNDKVVGVVICTEAWMHPQYVIDGSKDMTPAQSDKYYADLPTPSEHLERREVRYMTMMDRLGNVYVVRRVRGEEPELISKTQISGRIIAALRGILGIASWQRRAAKLEALFRVLSAEMVAGRRTARQVMEDIAQVVENTGVKLD